HGADRRRGRRRASRDPARRPRLGALRRLERSACGAAALLPAEVEIADAHAAARRPPLRHVGPRGRQGAGRGRELQARVRWRGRDVDRRARNAGHQTALSALALRGATPARRNGLMTDAPAGWDEAAVRSPGGHVLQSAAWARIRQEQGWRPQFLRIGDPLPLALVLWRTLPAGQRIAYVPRGPIVAAPAELPRALDALATLARDSRAIFLKVDPELDPADAIGPLRRAGFRRAADIQPVLATLVLDLAPDEDALLAAVNKDTRWSIRQTEKRGVAIREAAGEADLRALYDQIGRASCRERVSIAVADGAVQRNDTDPRQGAC